MHRCLSAAAGAAQVRVEALQTLRLANNSLAGPLPPLVEASNLAAISVAGNNLSGAAARAPAAPPGPSRRP
jgi:hypothetical protein